MQGYVHSFDRYVSTVVDRLFKHSKPFMLFCTLIGQPPFTVGVAAVVLGYGLALEKSFYTTAGIVALGTVVVTSLLKIFLHRRRPASEYVRKMMFKTFSFPSGHASGALVSYGLAALVISYRWPELWLIAWVTSMFFILFISLSRIFLKAHFASDIIGGWLVGGIGLLIILLLEK